MFMRHPTLVILAAGESAVFAGRKQQTAVGPDGEFLYDYTVYDALSCGFERVVFVVRPDNERDVKEAFEDRFGASVPVTYVRQFRPLGTGHAVASLGGLVGGPFGLANAGDLYGREALSSLGEKLMQFPETPDSGAPMRGCLVSYRLGDTLSEHGGVSRAVCRTGPDGRVCGLDEIIGIHWHQSDEVVGRHPDGEEIQLSLDDRVSMNLWGFDKEIVDAMSAGYNDWTYNLEPDETGEYRLSSALDGLLKDDALELEALAGPDDTWMGLSHRADAERVRKAVANAVERGDYPPSLKRAMRG